MPLSRTYPVFVDVETATKLGIPESEGRPESASNREGVYVGETAMVTTYQTWDEVPQNVRADILDRANRQTIQDAKNLTRADVKDSYSGKSGVKGLKKAREEAMKQALACAMAGDLTGAQKWGAEAQRLATEIENAK